MTFNRSASSGIVTQEVTMRCVDSEGESVVLEATLGYHATDPYAVTATFRTEICEVVWTFARELLTQGLTDPAGEGDVHVCPAWMPTAAPSSSSSSPPPTASCWCRRRPRRSPAS